MDSDRQLRIGGSCTVRVQTRHTNSISRRRATNSGFEELFSLRVLFRSSKNTRTRIAVNLVLSGVVLVPESHREWRS